jgi:hypothetical protein
VAEGFEHPLSVPAAHLRHTRASIGILAVAGLAERKYYATMPV